MSNQVMSLVEKASLKAERPQFAVGDTVDVHCRILEGDKERIQIFNGLVIARAGSGTRETFTVRRIVQGEGVERKFPLHSPRVAKIEVKRSGVIRRAKFYSSAIGPARPSGSRNAAPKWKSSTDVQVGRLEARRFLNTWGPRSVVSWTPQKGGWPQKLRKAK